MAELHGRLWTDAETGPHRQGNDQWMEPQAAALMVKCVDKSMIDKNEYPQTAEFERRWVAMSRPGSSRSSRRGDWCFSNRDVSRLGHAIR